MFNKLRRTEGEHKSVTRKQRQPISFQPEKLQGSQFRLLNQYLYTHSGKEAHQYFSQNPQHFQIYHQGYRKQVQGWQVNPVEQIAQQLSHVVQGLKVLDLGCGQASLQQYLQTIQNPPLKIYSVDLFKSKPFVIRANLNKLPFKTHMADLVVFCLSLMGTDYLRFIQEGARVLKAGGQMWIAQVHSRCDNWRLFSLLMGQLGLKRQSAKKMGSKDFFILLKYKKVAIAERCQDISEILQGILAKEGIEEANLTALSNRLLRACVYKAR